MGRGGFGEEYSRRGKVWQGSLIRFVRQVGNGKMDLVVVGRDADDR